MVSTLEKMHVPNGTWPGVRRYKLTIDFNDHTLIPLTIKLFRWMSTNPTITFSAICMFIRLQYSKRMYDPRFLVLNFEKLYQSRYKSIIFLFQSEQYTFCFFYINMFFYMYIYRHKLTFFKISLNLWPFFQGILCSLEQFKRSVGFWYKSTNPIGFSSFIFTMPSAINVNVSITMAFWYCILCIIILLIY